MGQFLKAKQQLRKLWIPTLLGIIAAISLIIQLANPINASDLWWHMLHGRHILESGSLIIDHSVFTWTPAVSYFPYTGWLGQIILYLTYEFTGSTGLIFLRYGAFFLIFLLGWRYAITRGIAAHPMTWTIILLGLALTWQAPLIKTELFTTAFFVIVVWLYFHMRYKGDQAWWMAYLLPLILAIWVNVHGAFVIASIFFVAAAIGEILNTKFCPNQAMPPRLKKHFFIALALCFPAILITPFGYDLPYLIISEILTHKGFHGRISGYIPTFLFNIAPYYLLDYMLIAMMLFVFLIWQKLKHRQTDWTVILAFLGYCAIYTQLARVTFFLGPVFLFSSLDLLAEKKDSWAWTSSNTRKSILIVLCILITSLIGVRTVTNNICRLSSYKNGIKQAFGISLSFPIDETEYIKKNLSGKKIGNMYRDGGYLEYHLWPEKKTLIDTRYFPFRSWINDYFDFVDGKNISQFVNNNHADYWLVNYKFINPFNWFNQSDAWKPAFLGPTGVIFVPARSAPKKPETASDLRYKIDIIDYAHTFRAAIELQDLAFAKRILESAQDIYGSSCSEHIILTHEMEDSLNGVQNYVNGNYEGAFQLLSKRNNYIYTQGKAADALMKLAEESWNNGDIHAARNWYIKIFEMLPKVSFTDIYNLAVLDRSYRFSNIKDYKAPTDDLHWQRLVVLILSQEKEIPQSLHFIVETAKAMKEGRYDGTAKLIPRSIEQHQD